MIYKSFIYSTTPENYMFFKTGDEWRVEPFVALEIERSRVFVGFEKFRAIKRLKSRLALHFLILSISFFSPLMGEIIRSDYLPEMYIPSPLFAFGQETIPKHTFSQEDFFYYLTGDGFFDFEYNMRFLYGVTNNFTFILAESLLYSHQVENQKIFGFSDLLVGCEYAFYNDIDMERKQLTRFTVAPYLLLPAGDKSLVRATTSFFLGATASHVSSKWYAYGSLGILFPSGRDDIDFGTGLLYEWGFGHTFFYTEKLFAHLMLEFSGIFDAADIINGLILTDPTARENIILVGPTFIFGTSWLSIFVGFQYPITQRVRPFNASFNMGFGLDFYFEF